MIKPELKLIVRELNAMNLHSYEAESKDEKGRRNGHDN